MYSTYSSFVRRFPWARRYIWAAVLFDNCYPILEPYCWWTLGTEAWGTRSCDDQKWRPDVARLSADEGPPKKQPESEVD